MANLSNKYLFIFYLFSFLTTSQEMRKKRMSLPANLNFMPDMLERQGLNNPTSPFAGMSRRERRVSLVSILLSRFPLSYFPFCAMLLS